MKLLIFWAVYCAVCGGIGAYVIQEPVQHPVYVTPDSIPLNYPAPADQ